MEYYIGIDGGGTSTICYIVDEKGNILGKGKAGSSVYHVTGIKKAKDAIYEAFIQAKMESGMNSNSFAAVCLGLAGVDTKKDYQKMNNAVKKLNLAEKVFLENDAVVALSGGTVTGRGVVLIAGTGTISFGINKRNKKRRAGGWGHIIGDEGSGYDIARNGIIAAVKAYDGRGEDTILLPMFIEKLNLVTMDDLMEKIYLSGLGRHQIAALVIAPKSR